MNVNEELSISQGTIGKDNHRYYSLSSGLSIAAKSSNRGHVRMDHSSEMILKGYDDLESPPPSDTDDLPTPPPDDQDYDDDDEFVDEYAGEYVFDDDDDIDDNEITCNDGIDVIHDSKYYYLYPHGDEEDDDLPPPPPEDSEGKSGLDN